MSDARNSSGNVRGGGAKQTGGAGRTNKAAAGGSSKSELLGGLAKQNDRSDAKRKLQLQVTSKELAASVRDKLLTYHTEEEYNAHDIPLPSTEDAKQKLKAMKEFTQKWYDKEFREQWLTTVTEVWLEELKAQYEAAVQAAMAAHNKNKNSNTTAGADGGEGEAMSMEELEEAIANLDANDVSLSEERQRLKKKLKRKKQKQKDKEKKKGN
jgi:hypothetical protein